MGTNSMEGPNSEASDATTPDGAAGTAATDPVEHLADGDLPYHRTVAAAYLAAHERLTAATAVEAAAASALRSWVGHLTAVYGLGAEDRVDAHGAIARAARSSAPGE